MASAGGLFATNGQGRWLCPMRLSVIPGRHQNEVLRMETARRARRTKKKRPDRRASGPAVSCRWLCLGYAFGLATGTSNG